MADQIRAPRPLGEDEFEKAVQSLIEDAEKYADANWKPARTDGWERYQGKVNAQPEPGGDDTVHAEVRDAVQQLMPEIMEQLAGGEEPVEYYSHDPAKAQQCRAATLFALGVWWEGGGWQAVYDAVMHAAVGRVGALKIHRHEQHCMEEAEVEGTPEEVDAQIGQPGYVLIDREDIPADLTQTVIDAATGQPMQVPVIGPDGAPATYVAHSVAQVRRYYVDAKIQIDAVDPAEIICTQTGDPNRALYVGQRSTVRYADLRSMGIEPGELEDVEGWDDTADDERAARTGEETEQKQDYGTWALRPVTLHEGYVLLDQDGDGLLERWKVIAVGDDKRLVRSERLRSPDDQPYVLFPYRRSPQTIQGLSVPDLVDDLQEVKTKLLRDLLDNAGDVATPLMIGSGSMNWAQLQTRRKDKYINEGVPGTLRWLTSPSIAGDLLGVLQHLDSLTEQRIGSGRTAQGLAPDQLTSVSAVAVAGAQAANQRAIKLTVRTIAECGLRPAFSKLLRLLVGEAPRAVVGESGGHQLVDPRKFDPAFGVRCRVGLGAMALEERKRAYGELIGLVAQLVAAPPPYNMVIDPPRVAALVQAAVGEHRGLGAARFFASPEEVAQKVAELQQQGPPPDPKMEEVKGKLQLEGQKLQANMQTQGIKVQSDAAMKGQKAWMDYQAALQKIAADTAIKREELSMEGVLEKYAIDKGARSGQGNINRSK